MKNLLLFACAALSAGAACADDAALLKCRALSDTASRLACYDAIPAGSAPAEQKFGLGPAAQKPKEPDASRITSTIPGRFEGWGPRAIITLANGQVWKVTDDGETVLPPLQDPKVEISRSLLGAYYLQVEGYNSAARVTRVK